MKAFIIVYKRGTIESNIIIEAKNNGQARLTFEQLFKSCDITKVFELAKNEHHGYNYIKASGYLAMHELDENDKIRPGID